MTSPLLGSCVCDVDQPAFRKAMLARDMSIWEQLHTVPRGAPSQVICLNLSMFGWVLIPCQLSREGPEAQGNMTFEQMHILYHQCCG